MNACLQCKWERHSIYPATWCTHPTMPKNFLHGGSQMECKDARGDETRCGSEGKLFEQRVSWLKRVFG